MASATPQLADLTTVPTQAQVLAQEVLPQLVANGVNVTSWPIGGLYRGISQAVAFCRTNARLALAAITVAGFEDYVFGRTAAPGGLDVTGWAAFVAKQRYGIIQKPATYTQRTLTLTNSSTSAYANVQPGAMIVVFPSGNRYVLNQVVSIAAAVAGVPSVITATFRSEFQMALGLSYNGDTTGAAISLVTTNYPGVTVSNAAPVYSAISQVGSGLGTLTLTGAPIGQHNVTVKILTSGSVGSGGVTWSTSLDGAGFIVQSGTSVTNLGLFGCNIALNDNGGSFVAGTQYYFQWPGTDITQVGAVIETPQALGIRVTGLYPLLGFATDAFGNFVPPASPTQSAYIALTLSSNLNVVVAFAAVDAAVNNKINIYIAGQGGALLPTSVIAAVQAFFANFQMVTDVVNVVSPTARAITLALTGAIQVKAAQQASAQASLQSSLAAYFGGVDPAVSLGINGIVDYEYIASIIRRTPGVVRVPNTLTLNGGTVDLQLPVSVGQFEVAQWSQTVVGSPSCFVWQAV